MVALFDDCIDFCLCIGQIDAPDCDFMPRAGNVPAGIGMIAVLVIISLDDTWGDGEEQPTLAKMEEASSDEGRSTTIFLTGDADLGNVKSPGKISSGMRGSHFPMPMMMD